VWWGEGCWWWWHSPLKSEADIMCGGYYKYNTWICTSKTPTLRHDLVLGYKEIPTFRDLRNSYTPESATQVRVEYTNG
jgi:hypothetical protein